MLLKEIKMLDMDVLKEFVDVDKRLSELKADVKKLQARKTELDPYVINILIDNQIDRITVNGRTIYSKTRIALKLPKTNIEAIEALKASGFGDYVSEGYNTQSLSALLGEMVRNNEPLPEEFDGCIEYHKVVTANSTKSRN
jgi:hypothetical protein